MGELNVAGIVVRRRMSHPDGTHASIVAIGIGPNLAPTRRTRFKRETVVVVVAFGAAVFGRLASNAVGIVLVERKVSSGRTARIAGMAAQ